MISIHHILGAFCVTLFFVSIVVAQEKQNSAAPGIVTGGVINGKAAKLVQPSYPPAAKAVRASGAVNVQVLIDENGDVVSATAVSGHPLLRAAAVQAARGSKFLPTQLDGKPVKVNGVVIYNFVSDSSMNPAQIGFALASATFSPKPSENPPAYNLPNSLPDDWADERKQADILIHKQNQEKLRNTEKYEPKEMSLNTETETSSVIIGVRNPNVDELEKKPQIEIAQNLTDLLKKRYAGNEIQNWSFELGLALGKIQSQIDDDAKLRLNLGFLNQIAGTAPNNTPADVIDEIKSVSDIGGRNQIEAADKARIESLIKRLRLK